MIRGIEKRRLAEYAALLRPKGYNKPVQATDPRGLATTMSYDPATGNLLAVVVDAGGAPHVNARTSFTYNGTGKVLTTTNVSPDT